MSPPAPRLLRAWLDSLSSGIVEFDRDWPGPTPPAVALSGGLELAGLKRAPRIAAAKGYGYFLKGPASIVFAIAVRRLAGLDGSSRKLYLAGDFNGWQQAVGDDAWLLKPLVLDSERVLAWSGPASRIFMGGEPRFKFVTAESQWIVPPDDAPNSVRDDSGNINQYVDPLRTGAHLWRFELVTALDLASGWTVAAGSDPEPRQLIPGDFFFDLATDLPLGALVGSESTTFRLFAPRAETVTLHVCKDVASRGKAEAHPLERRGDRHGAAGTWEVTVGANLHGWLYWYSIEGPRDVSGQLARSTEVLDPYALAAVNHTGPGVVLAREWIGKGDPLYRPPPWQDLVIAEVHVRDLAARAPVEITPPERLGFEGLRKWVESPDFYLEHLGINCVELQPVQEFDNRELAEYHWGYMTCAFLAPASAFALAPEKASGVKEFQELVRAFHRRGMAVILDVVFNHVGEPAHLLAIDRLYYFEQDSAGNLANWSGCGNDLRASAAMAQRLIIDSCTHLIEAFGVDGFRFDLAELLGVRVLEAVEAALKKVKPGVVLIAEPWSFRGHIAGALRDTGWASWNDGFRNFLRDYVLGTGTADRLAYFIRGSPWYFAKWPSQTVNYTESHDDRTWLDSITENPGFDGTHPTPNDVRRTHLMASILMLSVGMPMVAEGQDFLRTKGGLGNTYRRGDVNALDYGRLYRQLGTHAYFSDWIAFRRSTRGRLLRHYSRPSEGFFRFFDSGGPALAVIINADCSKGPERLLYAVNPGIAETTFALDPAAVAGEWRQLADHERFFNPSSRAATQKVEPALTIGGLSCGLWVSGQSTENA